MLVLAATSAIILWRLQAIFYDEAMAGANNTMRDIVQSVTEPPPFSLADPTAGTLESLYNSNNLANWDSPTTFIQVDSATGYPLAKTGNLGGTTIPPNPNLSAKHDTAYRRIEMEARPFIVEDRLLRQGADAVVVHVAEPLDTVERTFLQARQAIAIVLAGAAVAVVLLSILLAAQATTPIDELSRAMREIGFDRLDRRLSWANRRDELGKLAASFNDLLGRLEEAFARERRFISDASHELKTPLTSINANAQMLLRWGDRDPAVRHESLETIARESSSLAEMVNGMLTLAKADRGDDVPKEPVSLAQVASEAVRGSASRAAEKHLELGFEHAGVPLVYGDASLLRQLAGNLIDNAIKFTERGRVDVRVGSEDGRAWLEVDDTGPGIPDEELPHVFDRFYRTDKARSRSVPGTGLGLAIVRSIARVHDGVVSVERTPAGGARFRVEFPRMELPLTDIQ
ncbi:MAG TPA: HAMP domain-containing sensor histidine kinase [Verrucomicrobiae bacterium]|nr:HAMP domain-containing sensor histidine kinase [Verrucomicrobiae bacterium]